MNDVYSLAQQVLEQELMAGMSQLLRGSLAKAVTWWGDKTFSDRAVANYCAYLVRRIGTFELFGAHRSVTISSAYVRLSLTQDIRRERFRSSKQIEQEVRYGSQPSDSPTGVDPIEAVVRSNGAFALLGQAGSGKTTSFRHIAVQAALGRIRGQTRLPLFLAVRDMHLPNLPSNELGGTRADERLHRHTNHIRAHLAELLKTFGVTEADRAVEGLLQSGRAMLLVDGLDEVASEHQDALRRELTEIRVRFPQAIVGVSARPLSLSVSMDGFQKWETLPLGPSERLLFIEKWFEPVNPVTGRALIKIAQADPRIIELGSSPLLLSILCALYNNDLQIPTQLDELYGRAVEGMLGGWDAFRTIARNTPLKGLSVRQRVTLVSYVAASLYEAGLLVFSSDSLYRDNVVRKICARLKIAPIDADDLLNSLFNDFGVVVERSPGLYTFSHLTIHEYLVARHAVNSREESKLITHALDPGWVVVFSLVAGMLHDATAFLSELVPMLLRPTPQAMVLLKSLWSASPTCDESRRRELEQMIAHYIAKHVAEVREHTGNWVIDDGVLHIVSKVNPLLAPRVSVKQGFHQGQALEDLATCLPIYIELLIVIGRDTKSLGLVGSPLDRFLSEGGWSVKSVNCDRSVTPPRHPSW